MGLNLKNKNLKTYVDSFGLMLTKNKPYEKTGDDGKGDCIGRTALALYTYGYNSKLLNGILKCYDDNYKGWRHPEYIGDYDKDNLSRDHVFYTIFILKYLGQDDKLKEFSKHIKWRISKKYTYSTDLLSWVKYICTGKKVYLYLYYLQVIPILFVSGIYNKFIRWLFGFKELPQNVYKHGNFFKLSKVKKFFAKTLFPTYSIFQATLQYELLPDSLLKRVLNKVLSLLITEHNYVMKLILGINVSKYRNYIESYRPSLGFRWTCNLDDTNDRDMTIIEYEDNCIDYDLLNKLYYEKYRTYKKA